MRKKIIYRRKYLPSWSISDAGPMRRLFIDLLGKNEVVDGGRWIQMCQAVM